jgi:hypothetical protein
MNQDGYVRLDACRTLELCPYALIDFLDEFDRHIGFARQTLDLCIQDFSGHVFMHPFFVATSVFSPGLDRLGIGLMVRRGKVLEVINSENQLLGLCSYLCDGNHMGSLGFRQENLPPGRFDRRPEGSDNAVESDSVGHYSACVIGFPSVRNRTLNVGRDFDLPTWAGPIPSRVCGTEQNRVGVTPILRGALFLQTADPP